VGKRNVSTAVGTRARHAEKLRALIVTAQALVADDKGLLAIDESTPTCDERFAALGIPQNVETRRAYRELIVTTPGLGSRSAA